MTARAPVPASLDALARSGRRGSRWVVIGALGTLGLVVVAGAALFLWDAGYGGRVLPGVRVGTTDLSGLDRASVERVLEAAYHPGQGRLVLHVSTSEIAIPYSTLGRRADIGAMVEEALDAGRSGSVIARAFAEVMQALNGTSVQPRLLVDRDALALSISRVLRTLDRSPVDATIAIGPDGFVSTAAHAGRAVDPTPVIAAAMEKLGRTDAPGEVVLDVDLRSVAPAHDDFAVTVARVRARQLIGDIEVVFGKSSWTIPSATVRQWVRFIAGPDGSVSPAVDAAQVSEALGAISKGVQLKPASATFLTARSGTVVGVAAAKDGRRLEVDVTVARIVDELMARSRGRPATPVTAMAVSVAPELTTEAATQTAPLLTRLGTWTTWFPVGSSNYYGANIWLPAQIINGTVLAPGQTFDWWRAVLPVTTARGFGPGGVIKTDHTEPTGALGGGMCSSSTTLFNAALRAGLRMGARSNHRYYIYRYPLGLDATVSIMGGGRQTMTFTNDTGHPILIRGFKIRGSGGRGYVRYEIWGVPDGRQVTIGRPVVTNLRKATTRTVLVSMLRHGVRKQVEYPSNGQDVSVTRVVRDAQGNVIHRDVYRSHYVLWNGLIEVGA